MGPHTYSPVQMNTCRLATLFHWGWIPFSFTAVSVRRFPWKQGLTGNNRSERKKSSALPTSPPLLLCVHHSEYHHLPQPPFPVMHFELITGFDGAADHSACLHLWQQHKTFKSKSPTELSTIFMPPPPTSIPPTPSVITPCLLPTQDHYYGPLWPQSQLRGQRRWSSDSL